jgi:hypothetical protein
LHVSAEDDVKVLCVGAEKDDVTSGKGRPRKKAKLGDAAAAASSQGSDDEWEVEEDANPNAILWRANKEHFHRVLL